jgi:hypothetical protein
MLMFNVPYCLYWCISCNYCISADDRFILKDLKIVNDSKYTDSDRVVHENNCFFMFNTKYLPRIWNMLTWKCMNS